MKTRQLVISAVLTLALALLGLSALAVTRSVTVRVEGMRCAGCATSVGKKLKATPGVAEVRVSYDKKEARVKFDDEKGAGAQLREAINSTGFEAAD